ncbi:MAG: ABC transporter permease [Spirochaetota bacterium]
MTHDNERGADHGGGKILGALKSFGAPRLIIIGFLVVLWILALAIKIPMPALFSDTLVRLGMNAVLTLAMLPSITGGTSLFFGLPLGIICGLLGGVMSIEMNLRGFSAFFGAIAMSLPLAVLVGLGYGWLMNRVKGSEMTVGTYIGFAFVSLMSFGWVTLPFKNPEMAWAIGKGVRVTVSLEGRFSGILNKFLSFTIAGIKVPTGSLLFLTLVCLLVWLFYRSKLGHAMRFAGMNPKFAEASGINVNRMRVLGIVISTILGAVGILVYAQGFGFLQLYNAPMYMGFIAAAGILIGGASLKSAKISHVLLGTFLFHGILVVALPVANTVATLGSLAEISRAIVSNGIILYALAQKGGES